jgi:hypothetical protein
MLVSSNHLRSRIDVCGRSRGHRPAEATKNPAVLDHHPRDHGIHEPTGVTDGEA